MREEVAPKSYERYAEIVENFLTPALGNLLFVKLTPSHIQEAYNTWATGGRRDAGQKLEGVMSVRARFAG